MTGEKTTRAFGWRVYGLGVMALGMACLAICLFLINCGGKSERSHVRMANPGVGFQTQYLPISLAESLGYYQKKDSTSRSGNQ
jgi:hypothetical protein